MKINAPVKFVSQVRYQTKNAEIFMFNNSSDSNYYQLELAFDPSITKNKQPWLWDAVSGERYKLKLNDGKLPIDLGPADAKLIVFNKDRKGKEWKPVPVSSADEQILNNIWDVTFEHTNGKVWSDTINKLEDLKELPKYRDFSGTVTYKANFDLQNKNKFEYLNLGKVYGISQVKINGKDAGTQWYGLRIFPLKDLLNKGQNSIEIKVVTTMGNYMKTLKDNPVAQYWTNEKRKDQPIQSMGLAGPVSIY
jgi:hypothetical protein